MKLFDLQKNYTQWLPENKEGRILDIGCGHGRLLSFLHKNGYKNIIGIDRDQQTLLQVSSELRPFTHYTPELLDYLKNTKERFHCIFLKDVIYYLDHKEISLCLNLVNQLLLPGGTVVIEIFNGASLFGPYVKYKDFFIKTILTEQSIATALESAKLRTIFIGGIKIPVSGFRSALYFLLNHVWKALLSILYYLERGSDAQNPKILDKKIIAVAKRLS